MFSRITTEARAAIALLPTFAHAAKRTSVTPQDLAAALHSQRAGNTAALWTDPHPGPPPSSSLTPSDFDQPLKQVLEQAGRIAMTANAEHIGTEHLLAALLRTDPSSPVVAWLSERGATSEAMDALLTRLAGGLGSESLAEKPSFMERRKWNAARAHSQGKHSGLSTTMTIALTVILIVIVLALCIWSGP
ncbi:Clp protease N-terminal domain-containing protein [Dactylosporangium sp. CS-033363]|uniref:Clp protease N-terminal domain-containing protein n=1 Tax=Dactylosporangium sp. CS-033363 TaxID=3239935 RepID=UPI003D90A09C